MLDPVACLVVLVIMRGVSLTFSVVFSLFVAKVAKDCGVKLMTAFQRRFDPSFSRLQVGLAFSAVHNSCAIFQ